MCHFILSWRYFETFTVLEHLNSLLTNFPLGHECWKWGDGKRKSNFETFPIKNTSQHWLHGTGGCRSRRSRNASNLLSCASPGADNVHSRSILAVGEKHTKLSIIRGNLCSTHSGFWTFTFNMLEACERLRNCFRSFDVVTLGCNNSPKYSNDNQRRALHTYGLTSSF